TSARRSGSGLVTPRRRATAAPRPRRLGDSGRLPLERAAAPPKLTVSNGVTSVRRQGVGRQGRGGWWWGVSPPWAGAGGVRGRRGRLMGEGRGEGMGAGKRELLAAIAQTNGIATEDIASAFFTSTADLRSAFPARAARELGWTDVPLLGATEVDNPGAPPRCIRGLLHWNTSRRQDEIVPVYLP